jgi:hypothetical protein
VFTSDLEGLVVASSSLGGSGGTAEGDVLVRETLDDRTGDIRVSSQSRVSLHTICAEGCSASDCECSAAESKASSSTTGARHV